MSVYLDHNATSPLLPEVLDAMRPWLGAPANPASAHQAGQRAAAALDRAREQVSGLLERPPAGIVFTSGATEANHLALRGLFARGARTFAAADIEHPCVLGALAWIADAGGTIERLPTSAGGRVDLDGGSSAVDVWVCMAANHETGVIQPVGQALARGTTHVDATQGAGRMPLALADAETVVLSSHKLGGPAGVGVLSLSDGEPFPPLWTGGGQERGRRAGTVNVAGAVGLGAACALAQAELAQRRGRWQQQISRLDAGVGALAGDRVGAPPLLPNTRCYVFDGLRGELLVQALDLRGIAVSSGAACASGSLEPSAVLVAMGHKQPDGALRVSLGPRSTDDDVERFLAALPEVLSSLRGAAALEL